MFVKSPFIGSFGRLALAVSVVALVGVGCGAPAADGPTEDTGGSGGKAAGGKTGSGGKGGGSGSGGKGGASGGDGGSGGASSGSGGTSAEGGASAGGSGGESPVDAGDEPDMAAGGTGGGEVTGGAGAGGVVGSGGNVGTGGTSATGGASGGVCAPPYMEGPGLPGTCGATCPRCSGGDPAIEKIYALTPPNGKNKVSQDYKLDSEKTDPDSTPVVVKAAIYGLKGALYWVSDLDVDCDGKPTPGKCNATNDGSYQGDTAFHGPAGALTAAKTPYVVIPNNFPLGPNGLKGGQVIAVIFGGKIQYAVFGDTGPADIIGEASYACAEKLGIPPSAIDGGMNGRSVTYIAFTGAGTVPSNIEDLTETKALGEKLMAKFLQDNAP